MWKTQVLTIMMMKHKQIGFRISSNFFWMFYVMEFLTNILLFISFLTFVCVAISPNPILLTKFTLGVIVKPPLYHTEAVHG